MDLGSGSDQSSLAPEAVTTIAEFFNLPPHGDVAENIKVHCPNRYDALKDLSETRHGMRYEGGHTALLIIAINFSCCCEVSFMSSWPARKKTIQNFTPDLKRLMPRS